MKCFILGLLANAVVALAPGSVFASDGINIWVTKCSGCHGSLTSFGPRRTSRIKSAIIINLGGMHNLTTTLTAEDIQAVADALSRKASPPTTKH